MTEMQIHVFRVVGEATKLRNFWHVMLYHFFFIIKKCKRDDQSGFFTWA